MLLNQIQNLTFEVLTSVTVTSTVFWEVTPYNLVDVYRRFVTNLLAFLAYSSILKMEVVRFSETSVNFCHTIRPHISEYSALNAQYLKHEHKS
jgi:hypothetical protein